MTSNIEINKRKASHTKSILCFMVASRDGSRAAIGTESKTGSGPGTWACSQVVAMLSFGRVPWELLEFLKDLFRVSLSPQGSASTARDFYCQRKKKPKISENLADRVVEMAINKKHRKELKFITRTSFRRPGGWGYQSTHTGDLSGFTMVTSKNKHMLKKMNFRKSRWPNTAFRLPT